MGIRKNRIGCLLKNYEKKHHAVLKKVIMTECWQSSYGIITM